jgi:hypothetical protein
VFPLLKYPSFNIRLKQDNKDKLFVFDSIRKKWLLLSQEEWVRQHFVNFLVDQKKYPASLISLEKEIELNGTKKRYDIVVYSKQLKPEIIIECKAPEIELSEQVLEQALRYNLILNVNYVVITNGLIDAIYHKGKSLNELPVFDDLFS